MLFRSIDVGIKYIAAWLEGNGCVPLYNLMEDAATAEISRAQVWQWMKYKAKTDDTGDEITRDLVSRLADDIVNENQSCAKAAKMFVAMCSSRKLQNFLTTSAYELI